MCSLRLDVTDRWNHYAPSKGIETHGVTDVMAHQRYVGITMPRLRGLKHLWHSVWPIGSDSWNHYAPSKGIETR